MYGLTWQKSSYSGNAGNGECVELGVATDGASLLRESDDPDIVITAQATRLSGLLAAIKASRFDRLG